MRPQSVPTPKKPKVGDVRPNTVPGRRGRSGTQRTDKPDGDQPVDLEEFEHKLRVADPYGRWKAANRQMQNAQQRFELAQGDFEHPELAVRMARRNQARKKNVHDNFKEVALSDDATAKAMRADRVERWKQDNSIHNPSVRGILRIDDGVSYRQRDPEIRKADSKADMIFMLDNADALLDPVERLHMATSSTEHRLEQEAARKDRLARMAETEEKFGIGKIHVQEKKQQVKKPVPFFQRPEQPKASEVVFLEPVSMSVGQFDRWMQKYLRRFALLPGKRSTSRATTRVSTRKSVGFDLSPG
ncbi:unnamed protein product [Effrenium voratum]|uniref:Uncharacterized protein n=1 Tax=Effrenium voratum TaxID=2562239 RepID=A0AA36IEH2_9DINO|nr:unnamed protein product [Effrenium voratum]CAJ1439445.1 unnamed protein product [Effrenium voratum]